MGAGAARNAGIERASNDWVAFLDSDDYWSPQKLEFVMAAIRSQPKVNCVSHNVRVIDSLLDVPGSVLRFGKPPAPRKPIASALFRRNIFTPSAMVIRLDMLRRAGAFDNTFPSGQDYELWLRLSTQLRPAFIDDVLSFYVVRPSSITAGPALARFGHLLRILVRHRRKVSRKDFAFALLRHSAAFVRGVLIGLR
jgi:glycosyltransferase involved in cell wall biosynthesis